MKTGVDIIRDERERQINIEGWTEEHDDQHTDSSLAIAAATYATPEIVRYKNGSTCDMSREGLWPEYWDESWFKPTPDDRIKELAKAGALIAAEIDRLQRL